jgi:hypothetical protein
MSTGSCCRSARFSSASSLRVRNSDLIVPQTVQRSVHTRPTAPAEALWLHAFLPDRLLGKHRLERGRPAVQCGRQELADGERLLLFFEGSWLEGTLRLHGDGGVPIANPIVVLARPHRTVTLTIDSRLRLRRKNIYAAPPELRGYDVTYRSR